MLTQTHKRRKIVAKLHPSEIQRIKDFIQGSVYCFCKNCPDQWFAARDLFGGENYYWSGTPLLELYKWHEHNRSSDAVKMAGIDVGWLLLDVIDDDKRMFDLGEGFTHQYKWTGIEDNS